MDENNLQNKMKKEMSLFWEATNGFISTYKKTASIEEALPYLRDLAILSTVGLSRRAWGDDFKKVDQVNDTYFHETVITLSLKTDPTSKMALSLLFTTTPPVRDAILELYKDTSLAEKRDPLLKKLGECSSNLKSASDEAIALAKKILNRATLDLHSISSVSFNAIYNEIKKSPEYHPSFLQHLSLNRTKFKEEDKLNLEVLKNDVNEAADDFARYECLLVFIRKDPKSPIALKLAPLVLEQKVIFKVNNP
jgi:hypothetical protein